MRAQQAIRIRRRWNSGFFRQYTARAKAGVKVAISHKGMMRKASAPGLVKLVEVETSHGDGGGDTQHRDQSAEACAEQPDAAVPAHVVAAYQ